ncbi:MAG: hypothetical protein H6R10_784 [Rhodocyclaceae bacterium]|nr:hypothetical protein [Rhodocyclaceae bacterium]
MKKLQTIPVQDLLPGMRVASAVADDGGRILLPAGAELSEATIGGLKRREIQEITVEVEVPDDPAALERHRQQVMERLGRLFRHAGEDRETQALYQAILKYRLEQRP